MTARALPVPSARVRLVAGLVAALASAAWVAPKARAAWDDRRLATGRTIEGYASKVSVVPGERLYLRVSTDPPERFRVDVYRLGWNGGEDPVRLHCLPSCTTDKLGVARAMPEPESGTGRVRVNWTVTNQLPIASTWPSGYYVARLVLTTGPGAGTGRFVPFIVREPATRRAGVLVQASVNTWQAYNDWGGKSLYLPRDAPANRVSFDRPYAGFHTNHHSAFDWEVQLLRFLERNGYDVAYTTDVDVHRDPSQLLGRELVIAAGHSEYWSKQQRDAFDAARDAGVDLVFPGANNAYWQVRYEDAERTVVGYKSQPDPITDPSLKTTQFRLLKPPRPECELLGIQYRPGSILRTSGSDYTIQPAALAHPWMQGSGFNARSVVRGVVGYEWDGIEPACATPPLTTFFENRDRTQPAHAVTHTASSGARVFAGGTMQFSWALDDYGRAAGRLDPRMQQFTRNLLDDLAGRPSRAPRATTGEVTSAGERRATVTGTVDARGAATTYHVEYGPSLDYGSSSVPAGAGSGTSGVAVSAELGPLHPGATYHYRLVAEHGDGARWYGGDRTFTTAGAPDYAATVFADEPRSYWRLGEAGGTVAADAMNANPGAYAGTRALGRSGITADDTAVELSGTGHVSVRDTAALRTGDRFTFEAWVKGGRAGVTQGFGQHAENWQVYVEGGNLLSLHKPGIGLIARSTRPIPDRTGWHHVAVTKDGTAVRLYIDGNDVTGAVTDRGRIRTTAGALRIGAGAAYFDGMMDEVALYDHALQAARVRAHHAAAAGAR